MGYVWRNSRALVYPHDHRSNEYSVLCHMRKGSKSEVSVIQRKIWEHCKRIIRARYPHSCYTCGMMGLTGVNCQTGHLWAKASLGAFMKYDLRVLRIQCFRCNIHLGGMGAVFYARMLKENGKAYMTRLEKDRQVEVRALDHYREILSEYEQIQT